MSYLNDPFRPKMEWEMQGLTHSEYTSVHKWLRANYPKDSLFCFHCRSTEAKLDFALVKGHRYIKNIGCYMPLCKPCHFAYDQRTKPQMPISYDELKDMHYGELKRLERTLKDLLEATTGLRKMKAPNHIKKKAA